MSKVQLLNVVKNDLEHFDKEHAEAILSYDTPRGNHVYKLPENSKFSFIDGNIITTPVPRSNQNAPKRDADSESN